MAAFSYRELTGHTRAAALKTQGQGCHASPVITLLSEQLPVAELEPVPKSQSQ
jgi:hypothetical protein